MSYDSERRELELEAARDVIAAKDAEIARLREALKPFSAAADAIDFLGMGKALFRDEETAFAQNYNHGCMWTMDGVSKSLTWADFRRAHTALAPKSSERGSK